MARRHRASLTTNRLAIGHSCLDWGPDSSEISGLAYRMSYIKPALQMQAIARDRRTGLFSIRRRPGTVVPLPRSRARAILVRLRAHLALFVMTESGFSLLRWLCVSRH